MLHILIKSCRKLIESLTKAQLDEYQPDPEKISKKTEEVEETPLENNCGHFYIYFREDGEFAVASEFMRQDKDVSDISGVLLHMINSGTLADYFVKSLKAWAEGDTEKESFAREVIKEWKKLFYEQNENEIKNLKTNSSLAVDPSEVFGLKRIE